MKLIVFIALLGLVGAEEALSRNARFASGIVSQHCLQCMCMVESGCRQIGCQYDVNSDSCGQFQIKLPYWIDCHKPMPSTHCHGDDDCWRKCANEERCASKCVQSYMSRYVGYDHACRHDCESYARLHNGGPHGCTHHSATNAYWQKYHQFGC